jgi:acetylglutamate kinase
MPIPKIEITNPEAIELINKFKSGEIKNTIIAWIKKNRWYLIAAVAVIVLVTALVIGKSLSEKNPAPTFSPPDIETVQQEENETIESQFSDLRLDIQNQVTDLPDPYIPVFDDQINLEETIL